MSKAEGLVHLWNTWGIQILVLASFVLQLFLLICGGIRRRSSSTVLRVSLWLAYLLADSTAIYALGRLSIMSRSSSSSSSTSASEHQQKLELVAFWAPFLLLHLGGPDNITAYALEDNSLWLRHLQTLVVQVLGAAYVIYRYNTYYPTAPGSGLLLAATMSMFVAGCVKYGERIWALKCGSMSSIRDRFDKWDHRANPEQFVVEGKSEEEILLEAHHSFAVCKSVFLDVTLGLSSPNLRGEMVVLGEGTYKLVEMELSLMYDILYTKAAVIHTWYGLCIHLVSLLGTATAFVLFQLSIVHHYSYYSTADVAISHVLVAVALLLEAISVCKAVFSSWTCSFLLHRRAQAQAQRGSTTHLACCLALLAEWLLRFLASLRRPFGRALARRRLWRGSVGQYNLFHLCTRDAAEPWSRLATKMGLRDWWNKLHFKGTFSGTEPLSTQDLRELVLEALPLADIDAPHTNLSSRGRIVLENSGAYEERSLARWSVGIDLDESILVWHIATDVFIKESNAASHEDLVKLVEATKVLSNYMLFLLVTKPDMLPGHASHSLYLDICTKLEYHWTRREDDDSSARPGYPGPNPSPRRSCWNPWHMLKELFHHEGPNCSRTIPQREELAEKLSNSFRDYPESIRRGERVDPRRQPFGESGHKCAVLLARELLDMGRPDDTLRLIFGVWVEMMLYAAEHCSRDSHARHLSKGGEFITIVWLLVYHRMYIEPYNQYVELLMMNVLDPPDV